MPLSEVSPPKIGVRISVRHTDGKCGRPVVATSLGPIVLGAANPHGDPSHVPNVVRSVIKRVGCQPPHPNRWIRRRFKSFVQRWVRTNIVPMAADQDLDPRVWIRNTPYSNSRKEALLELCAKMESCDSKYDLSSYVVKCFPKDESYPSYKHIRGIYARVDEFKIRVGPIFSALEKQLYDHPQFIKHIPVNERARYVYDRIHRDGAQYIATDYTAFESHFTRRLFEECEFELYRYFVKDNADAAATIKYFCRVVGGINRCEFKDVRARIPACRMSGEMCTSLGNGFTNLMVFLFLCELFGFEDSDCVIEGDDCLARICPTRLGHCSRCCLDKPICCNRTNCGVTAYKGRIYQSCGRHKRVVTRQPCCVACARADDFIRFGIVGDRGNTLHSSVTSYYVAMGFNVKIEFHNKVERASFCSMVFDSDTFVVVPAPMKKILNLGWAHRKFHNSSEKVKSELLRGKAMSLLAESVGAPILQSLALALLRLTSEHYYRIDDWWTRQKMTGLSLAPMPVNMQTRLVMEEAYGVSVFDQFALEQHFDRLTDAKSPIDHPILLSYCSFEQIHYATHYVRVYCGTDPDFELPKCNFDILSLLHASSKTKESNQSSQVRRC